MKKNAVSTLLILATVMAMISSGASVWPAAGECRGPMQLYSAGSIGACSALGGALFPAGELNACQNSSAMFPTAELKACAESGPLFPSLALNACYGPLSLTAEASQLQACYKTEPMFLAQAMSGCSGPNRLFATSALTDCSGPHALSFTTQSPALTACSGPYRLFEAPIESACYGPVILNLPSAPAKPSNTLPAPGEQNVPLGPGLQASPFSDPDGIVTQAAAQWQVRMTTSSADYSVVVFDSGADAANLSGIIVPAGCLVNDTMYSWHVRYQGASNLWSPWSDETSFTTVRRTTPVAPNQPLNTLPQDQAINVSLTPALQSSPFSDANGDAHAASQWQIRVAAAAPDYSTTVFDTGETSANLTTCLVSVGYLNYDTSYFWRVRHRDSSSADVDGRGLWSAWSQETEFRTLANGANHAPNQPVNLEPIADQTGISTAPLLRASAFGDQDSGDFQTASEWRIRSAAGDYAAPVYDSGVLFGAVSEHWIAPGRLLGNTVYYWQVRYRDSRDSWSAWSLETSFHTALHGELEAPQGLRAVAGARSVWLTWILNDNCRVIGYNVYRADSASLPLLKITVAPVRGNEYLDQNLTPHQTYYYCISAVAASGAESAMTAPVEALVGATRVFMTNLRGLPGQKAQGWVTIDNPNDIANEAMLVEIKYDPALLSPSGVQTTPLSAAFHIDWNRGVSDGLLRTVGLGSGVKLVGEGHVLQTTWQISSSAPLWTRSELNFGDVELYYLRNSDSGTTIAQIGVDATLSATLTIGQPILLGDVTLDGKVNPADLVWLREIILGHVIPMEEQKEAGDLNGDKLLDSADTVLLWHLILYGNCNPTPAMAARKALGLGAAAHNLSWDLQTNLGPTRLAVPLMLDEREGIAGMDVVVNFDPSRLQLVSIERGPDCDFDILTNNVVNGQARLLFDVRNDVTAGGGARMATLVFEALGMWERTMLYTVKFKASGADGVNLMRTRSIAVSDAQIAYPASSQIAVQGLITDRLTNAPVAGAEVAIEGATSQTMTTGADGRYQAQRWRRSRASRSARRA
ncbi:MAG: hypothetical protein NTX50_08090 [Candidatus Sumerlaeota bacterium]|nr:hypothetical protein [Candidatus Sumerlaeota bacterium]